MIISCDCSIEVDVLPDVYHEEMRKARKEHTCCECDRTIEPGESYHHVTGKWEDEWSTFKTCLGCSRIRDHFCRFGAEFGNLPAQIEECVGFNYVSEQ